MRSTEGRRRVPRWFVALAALLTVALLAGALAVELRGSRGQAALFSRIAAEATFDVAAGPADAIRFPRHGPFDERLGYVALPRFVERLQPLGFEVAAQARWSARALELDDLGLTLPYREKTRAGLEILDCRADAVHVAAVPQRVFRDFDAVPPLLVASLLFIENRTLLDDGEPTRNPAVEWARLARALLDQMLRSVDADRATAGGSTLATQIEKFRHSPAGRTDSAAEKGRQMLSASLRAYMDGEDTRATRRQIVVDYLNGVPLAARPGIGEVSGLLDGLWAWYGREAGALELLRAGAGPQAAPAARALLFKQALSLLVAQRRPGHYLAGGPPGLAALEALTDSHLRLLAAAGLIDTGLRDAALAQTLDLAAPPAPEAPSFVERKAATALRARLAPLLEVQRLYDLDRLDFRVGSSVDGAAQQRLGALLEGLRTREGARAAGLYGRFLLADGQDPAPLQYSLALYERGEVGNLLRLQTDTVDLPFDVNEGARLDLGSTAKLRTLVSYLEIVAGLHARWQGLDAAALAAERSRRGRDALATWALDHLAASPDRSLPAMLEAAMQRRYSASPAEAFYTGGGLHRFDNFERDDDRRVLGVAEAFRRSVNLVFIRLMRDIVRHLVAEGPGPGLEVIDDRGHPARRALLEQVADEEGRQFLAGFYGRYRGLARQEALDRLLAGVRPAAAPLASALLAVDPDAGVQALGELLRSRLGAMAPEGRALQALHDRHRAFGLADQAYVSRRHPLELWLVGHLIRHPDSDFAQVLAASASTRQEAYGWLFNTRNARAQERRLRDLLERRAFAELQRRWARLGYPFAQLTPSYASSIGASGDRPAALAELVGIIAGGGLRRPVVRLESLVFGADTPYETRLRRRAEAGEPVLDPAVAATVRGALRDVVANGTARRLAGALAGRDGTDELPIGAKTGTGDHRRKVHGPGGVQRGEVVVSRSATLVFTIGDRHFGTLVAYVEGPQAARYRFTSALPAQLLKALLPALRPMLVGPPCAAPPPAAAGGG